MRPIIVAQISDAHLGFAAGGDDEPNRRRLAAVIADLARLDPAPDHLVVSGDLTEHGEAASYARVRDLLAAAPCPVSVMAGNHDLRRPLGEAFPGAVADGFVQRVVDLGDLRLLLLDTLEEGRHGGGFCAARAGWAAARLDEAPGVPTLVFVHHPPVAVGIGWMDPDPAEPWIARLAATLRDRRQVVGLASGHLHRPIATGWEGLPLTVCPSTAPELAPVLAPIDPATPDDRPLIVADAPGYALHRWDGERLVTHMVRLGGEVVARFTPALQPMIVAMARERASAGDPRGEARDLGEA